jgi:hypothetical protein
VVMRMRGQTAVGEVDASAIEEFAAGRDGDEHRRVTVLDDTDRRRLDDTRLRHMPLRSRQKL